MKYLFAPLMLASVLVLSACGPTPPTPEPFTPDKVRGQLSNWPYTATVLSLYALTQQQDSLLSPAAIPAGGVVNGMLPNLSLTKSLLDGCTLSSGFTGGAGKYDVGTLQVFSNQGDYLGQIFESDGSTALLRFYSSAATALKGSANCSAQDIFDFDVNLAAGWNILRVTLEGDGVTLKFTNATSGVTPILKFSKADEHVYIQFNQTEPITLKREEYKDVQVKIFQDGGVSGDINLRTFMNGVDITPSVITLPANVGMQNLIGRSRLKNALPLALKGSIRAQAVTRTLRISATSYAPEFTGDLEVMASRGVSGSIVGNGTLKNFKLIIPQLSIESYQALTGIGSTTDFKFQLYPQNYRGQVSISLEGLPDGMQATSQTVEFTDGQSKNINIPVSVTDTFLPRHVLVTIKATQLNDGYVITKQQAIAVIQQGIRMVDGTSSMAVGDDGNLWYATAKGMIRQHPDGTYETFVNPGYNCGDLIFGQDQAIWQTSAPQVRFDSITGTAQIMNDPRGFSGCGGGMHFDAKARGWDTYGGIQRLDYSLGKAETVPGSSNDFLLDIEGNQVWGQTFSGTPQLVEIDGDTLQRQVFNIPGVTVLSPAFVRQGKVWLPKSVSNQLAVFDPATGQLQQFSVTLDGKHVSNFDVLGVDNQGRHWLEVGYALGDVYVKDWLLYNPLSGTVEKRYPAFFSSGSGNLRAVGPDGTLWVRTTNQTTLVATAYVFKP